MAIADVPLADTLARPLRDRRISVTDRCQFRCTYCMPREVFGRDFVFLPRGQLLTFEELTRLARIFAGLGAGGGAGRWLPRVRGRRPPRRRGGGWAAAGGEHPRGPRGGGAGGAGGAARGGGARPPLPLPGRRG